MSNVTAKDPADKDVGTKTQRLFGQSNYNIWAREFKVDARLRGVWKLFTGEENVLPKPNRRLYMPSSVTTPGASTRSSTDKEVAAQSDGDRETRARLQEYQFDLEDWRDNEKRVRLALALLSVSVHPTILNSLQEYDSPKEAWDWLKAQYKMSDKRALKITLAKIESLKLQFYNGIQAYINQHLLIQQEISDAGGTYNDNQLRAKLVRGLTPRYNTFVDMLDINEDDKNISIRELTGRLLTFESKIRARDQSKQGKPATNSNDDKLKDDKKQRSKCSYQPCGKWGHTEDVCRKKKADQGSKSGNRSVNATAYDGDFDENEFYKQISDKSLSTSPHPSTNTSIADDFQVEQHEPKKESCNQGSWVTENVLSPARCSPRMVVLMNTKLPTLTRDSQLADSAAFIHVVNRKTLFNTFKPLQMKIGTAEDGQVMQVLGGGDVPITLINKQGGTTTLTLPNVVYVPNSRCNLLSLPKIARQGYYGLWDDKGIEFLDCHNIPIGYAPLNDGLFVL